MHGETQYVNKKKNRISWKYSKIATNIRKFRINANEMAKQIKNTFPQLKKLTEKVRKYSKIPNTLKTGLINSLRERNMKIPENIEEKKRVKISRKQNIPCACRIVVNIF